MPDFQIITDSTTDISRDLIDSMGVVVIPMEFTMGGKSYLNYPEETEMTSREFYSKLRAGEQAVTSQINASRLKLVFEPYLKDGEDVLYFAFSSGLSGTYQSGVLAASDLMEKYPNRKIIVVDTLAASMGEGLLVYFACQQRDKGLSVDDVAQWARDNRLHIAHWFTVDDLNHLKRGGRVLGAAAFFGTVLNIKPVLHVDNDGHLIPKEKVRGRKASLDALISHYEKTGVKGSEQTIFISHGDCLEDARYVASKMHERFGIEKIFINPIGPVIGAHSGPGTVALFFYADSRD